MNRIIKILVLAAIVMSSLACEKYDDGKPAKDVRIEFNRMYPSAKDIEWDWDGIYWEVSFKMGNRPHVREYESWFDRDGQWMRTKSEIFISEIPQQIKDYLANDSTFGNASYADNDVDYIETQEGNFYRFDLIINGVVKKVDVSENGKVTNAN